MTRVDSATVLHVLDHSLPIHSGYSYRSWSIVQFQRQLGLRPVVLTSPKQEGRAVGVETIEGVPHYRTRGWRAVPFVRELAQMAKVAARIVSVARSERASVLHAHSPSLNGFPALLAARRCGVPVVYEARGFWEDAAVDHGSFKETSLRYRLSRALETVLFKLVDHVVVICEGMRRDIATRGVDPTGVTVIPNGVDTDWFQPLTRPSELSESHAPLTIGYVGSFYRYEGLRFLLESLPGIQQRIPGVRLLLVGGGEEERELRSIAAACNGDVTFAGWVPHGEIRRCYALIDVFVCPRRRMRLTELVTPLKPLEAMAMGKPVVASDVGGLKELIRHGLTGLLFPAESRAAFVEACVQLGGQRDLAASLGAEARNEMVTRRAWPHIVSRYLPVYEAIA
jgi:glycogen synthase